MRALPFVLATSLLLAPATAAANGRFPTANQLVVAPSDPSTYLVRTTFGLLLSRDRGANWDWICERVLQTSTQEDPAIGVTANGTIVSGEFAGLMISPDTGCSWTLAGDVLSGTSIVDLVVRKDSPHAALVLASRFASSDDAGNPTYTTQLFATTDDGAHFAKVGAAIDPTILVETVEVAPSDPNVVYVSGIRSGAGLLLASSDGGVTFTEHAVPLDAAHERAPFIAAVDPTSPALVYVRTSGSNPLDPTRLLVTKDGGATFTPVFSATGPLQGFALSPDGAKIYVGGPVDGLAVASRADFAFKHKTSAAISCLATQGSTLIGCSNEASGFFVGTSDDDGATFTAKLHLSGIRGPLTCTGGGNVSVCAQDWPALEENLAIGDAGATDAGTGGGSSSSKSCGCAAVGARAPFGIFALVVLGAAAAIARRASKHRR